MHVERVSLLNFRNFGSIKLELDRGINVFYGENAQGKTNFLEAVYLCSTGRSERSASDKELIRFGQADAHLQAIIRHDESVAADKIDVHLKRGDKKGVAVNGVAIKKLGQLFGVLLTVIFSPEDLRLIKAGPAERRRFMDVELCQLSNVYYYELQQYHHILKQRNNLLKSIRHSPGLKETIFVWDDQMTDHGVRIMQHRREFNRRINEIASETHSVLTGGKESLSIQYRPNITAEDAKAEFCERLKKNLERDIILGSTSSGIHKDDISFLINKEDARIYGSQGQQRTAALSAKLAEITLIREQKGSPPVLLLDDVLSELDESRRKHLLANMATLQTVLTCTDADGIPCATAMFKVEEGTIIRSY